LQREWPVSTDGERAHSTAAARRNAHPRGRRNPAGFEERQRYGRRSRAQRNCSGQKIEAKASTRCGAGRFMGWWAYPVTI
jgi:hypothetical protein